MCRVHPVNPSLVPSVEDTIQMYTDTGGTKTLNSSFWGRSPGKQSRTHQST